MCKRQWNVAIDLRRDGWKPHTYRFTCGTWSAPVQRHSRNIPLIKEIIANISFAEAAESTSHIDAIESTEDMAHWLKTLNKRLLGDVLQKLPISVDV
jgi:hypothetical protein